MSEPAPAAAPHRPAPWVLTRTEPGAGPAWPAAGRASSVVVGLGADAAGGCDGIDSAGVDLVDTRRFALAVSRSGPGFVKRLFGPAERAALAARGQARGTDHFAAAFGVKESVVKLVGGLPPGARFADVVVGPVEPGAVLRPLLGGVLAGWAAARDVELVGGVLPVGDGLTLAWAFALTRSGGAR